MRAAILLTLLLAGPAAASGQPAIGLFGIKVSGDARGVDARALELLTAKELARSAGLRVLRADELAGIGGAELSEKLASCEASRCSAELGARLGLEQVLSLELAAYGGVYVLAATVIDVSRGAPLARTTRIVRFLEQVPGALVEGARLAVEQAALRRGEPAPRRRVAVLATQLGFPAKGAGEAIAAMIAGELATDPALLVLGTADLHALVEEAPGGAGVCTEKTLACFTEIGGALGMEQLVTSELSKVGGEYVVALSIVEVKRAEALHRVVKRVSNADNVPDAAQMAVKEALFELRGTAEVAAAPRPAFVGEIVRPTARRDTFAWTLVGLGAASVLAGAGLEIDALIEQSATPGEATFGSLTEEGAARGFGAIGLVAIGFGATYLLSEADEEQVTAR